MTRNKVEKRQKKKKGIYNKTGRDSHIQRTNYWLPDERGKIRVWD